MATKVEPSARGPRKPQIVAIAWLACIVTIANAFAVYYVGQERTVYSWDGAGYWVRYSNIGSQLRNEPLQGLRTILTSIRHADYNALPIVPLTPVEWMFGSGRLAYILAIANVSLLLSVIALTKLSRHTLAADVSSRRVVTPLGLTAVCIVTMHVMWIPVLRGLPDVLGVAIIGVILLIQFSRPLTEQTWRQAAVIGPLLCMLILLRRWYLFWVVAFFPALIMARGMAIHQRFGWDWRRLAGVALKVAALWLLVIVLVFSVATPLVLRVVHTSYADTYSAYRLSGSIAEVADRLVAYFGWCLLASGIAGLVLLLLRKETLVFGGFLLVQSIVAFVLFARTQDFGAHHYYLFAPAIGIAVGALILQLWTRIRNRSLAALAVGAVIASSVTSSLAVFSSERVRAGVPLPAALMPAVRYPPAVRGDLPELDRLLRDVLDQGQLYVIASSEVLNFHLLQVACVMSRRVQASCDNILKTHEVDKRDGFPHQFLHARLVLVATPTQYHLRPGNQRVIGVLARDMIEGRGVGAAFRRLPVTYTLDHGVTVAVYSRFRTIELDELRRLRRELAEHYPEMGRTLSELERASHLE